MEDYTMEFKVGDRIILKKIDKRLKNPDLKIWRVVEVKPCAYSSENRYDLVEDEHGYDKKFDYLESALTKLYKRVEE